MWNYSWEEAVFVIFCLSSWEEAVFVIFCLSSWEEAVFIIFYLSSWEEAVFVIFCLSSWEEAVFVIFCLSSCRSFNTKELFDHFCDILSAGEDKADGTITLIKGPTNILVDTGGPSDRERLLSG